MSISSSINRQVSDDDFNIAQRIRQLRSQRGLSQTEVADALGVSFQQFQKYEQGRNRISAARLVSITRILGVTPHDILHWTGEEAMPSMPVLIDQKCGDFDHKVADLWHRIQSDLNALALMVLMEIIDKDLLEYKGVVVEECDRIDFWRI